MGSSRRGGTGGRLKGMMEQGQRLIAGLWGRRTAPVSAQEFEAASRQAGLAPARVRRRPS